MNYYFIRIVVLCFSVLLSCIFPHLVTAKEANDAQIMSVKPALTSLGPHVHREAIHQPLFKPSPPHIQASAYLLIDIHSGRILASKNANEKLAPASLTKMMTSYLVSRALHSGRLHLEERVTVSKKAGTTGGSRMFIAPGTKVTVQDLLQGVIVQSGNDASIAIAEHLAASEDGFADIMNQEAKRLGMNGTHFVNVSGLPNVDHYTTTLDMATLARAIILDFPQDYAWYSQKSFTYSGVKQPNRNRLLWQDVGVDGIKTGDTNEAGYCVAASAVKENMRLVVVIMGAPSDAVRIQSTQALLNYGFRFFETHKIYQAFEPVVKARVWFGSKSSVAAGLEHDLYVTILRGYGRYLKKVTTVQEKLKAPLPEKTPVGQARVMLNDETLVSVPLITIAPIAKGYWWRRWWDRLILFLFSQWR